MYYLCSFIAPCAYTMMPENVDLVIAEFTLNDGADDDTQHNKCAQQECPAFCNTGVESPIRQAFLDCKVYDFDTSQSGEEVQSSF